MIEQLDTVEKNTFTDPYHDVMSLSLQQRPRKASTFYRHSPSGTHASEDPDLGFCLSKAGQKHLQDWAKLIFQKRIPLIAGELQTHFSLLQQIGNIIPPEEKVEVFCRYENQDFVRHHGKPAALDGRYKVKVATAADLNRLFTFYERSEDMKAKSKASLLHTIENNRLVYLQRTGKLVSAALTHCENTTTALIGGVYTPARYRGKGYAAHCMKYLCNALLEEKKTPCLFYEKNNASARALYKKLGFIPHGEWIIIEMIYQEAAKSES